MILLIFLQIIYIRICCIYIYKYIYTIIYIYRRGQTKLSYILELSTIHIKLTTDENSIYFPYTLHNMTHKFLSSWTLENNIEIEK